MRMVTVTLPKHVDDALQQFLDHEVVRVEDAPPNRYEDEHLQEVKRLRHAYEGGSRVAIVVVNIPESGSAEVLYPDDAREVIVDWNEIESTSSAFLVEKLIEEIERLAGLDESRRLKKTLTQLQERLQSLNSDQ
jgi:predicted Zn-dependent protease with MMP-like domain